MRKSLQARAVVVGERGMKRANIRLMPTSLMILAFQTMKFSRLTISINIMPDPCTIMVIICIQRLK